MSDALERLAAAAGVATVWTDAFGREQRVAPEHLRPILAALGFPAGGESEIADGLARLAPGRALPPMRTADAGGALDLPSPAGRYVLRLEDGGRREGVSEAREGGSRLPVPDEAGYHRLEIDGQECLLAAAPARCHTLADARAAIGAPPGRSWGVATQFYSLRRRGDGGIGDCEALAALARAAGRRGADALSISPVHALFGADPDRFSPYAPSSRVVHNVLHAPIDLAGGDAAALEADPLIDWPRATRLRMAALEAEYRDAASREGGLAAFDAWLAEADEAVLLHARFETLHRHCARDLGLWNWRDWPEALRDPHEAGALAFTASRPDEVRWHAWLQFRIDRGLAAAQEAAIGAGMAVGIVSDLAVGADPAGSHCWSRRDECLIGLSVGAPPDLLSRDGQNWGITAFSPRGLRENGFRAFVEMFRAAVRHAGGVRIDHALGLNRLWVVPEGASAAEGAYLSMPEADLFRLIRLESRRARAIVLGEDLGTVPAGFAERLGAAGIGGMRVLWFERDADGRPHPPSDWTARASAMTTTHDLPTVAGWWKGVDIDWNERLGRAAPGDRDTRAGERGPLWAAMVESGAAHGPCPADWDAFPVVDAAIRHVGRSGCELAMLPLEDLLAQDQAPNLPGTTSEHPNWRRRLPGEASTMLEAPEVAARLAGLDEARSAPGRTPLPPK